MLGGDVSLAGAHAPLGAWRALDAERFGVLVDLRPRAARALAQCHGQVGRRDVPVIGVMERADDGGRIGVAAELEQRPQLLDAPGADHLERHADGVGRAAVLLVLVHALAAGRESQVTGHVEADVLSRLRRQSLVQIDRVLVELADGVAHVEQGQQPGGVPGGAGGQLGALDQRHVRPALPGQVIERAHAYHATSDHQHPNVRLHELIPPQAAQPRRRRSVASAVPAPDSNCDRTLLK